MIKKVFIALFILFCLNIRVFAQECTITCPAKSTKIFENESFFNRITGISFASKQIAETIIQKELKDELNSKFKAELELFSIKRLKQGEFKSLRLQSKLVQYKALNLSDFNAYTLCPYNKIIYKKNRLYYPLDLPFKFQALITNEDIKNILNSYEFQNEIKKSSVSFMGFKGFEILTPDIEIKGNKLYFSIPFTTIFSSRPHNIKFYTDLGIENNKITLKNITLLSKNNKITNDILGNIINKINPIAYQFESINTKYCKIYISNVKIDNEKIKTEGIFIINKNYGGNNE